MIIGRYFPGGRPWGYLPWDPKSVAAVVSCYCFVIVLGLGALFLLFVLLYSQRVASHSCETLLELLHDACGK